jgi:hypothetical protein
MRGGALPLLAWFGILSVLLAGAWVWTGDAIEVGELGLAVGLVALSAALLIGRGREAARRGAPAAPGADELDADPDDSFGAVGVGIALASIVFGLAFGRFLIYFGIGLLALALGRIAVELRSQRRSRRMLARRSEPTEGGGA